MSKDWLSQPIFIQSFAPTSLIYVSNLTDSPKIFLIDDVNVPNSGFMSKSCSEITSDAYFDYIKQYVVGIRPWKDTVVPPIENHLTTATDLVAKQHAHDLLVHPYTYRNEFMFLLLNFHHDPYGEYDFWINMIGTDGLFSDFTGSLHNFEDRTSHSSKNKKSEV
ncbi:glycerophosphodiester phosphodiesterase GDPD5-like [Nymphaea colorata]|nr:glycerophosphodiester phosphodiesterase GDPD5-like [Nymphaea colorata]